MSNNTNPADDYQKYTKILNKINRLTNGGRNLFAIHENFTLSHFEKHFLLTLAAYMDFSQLDKNCSYCEEKASLSISRLCKLLSADVKTVIKYTNILIEKGYIKKIQTGFDTASFIITNKIFIEYAVILKIDLDAFLKSNTSTNGTGGDPVPPPDTSTNGTGGDPVGVLDDVQNNLPNCPNSELHNNKLLCSDGASKAPTKQRKSKKSTPKERARKLFRTIYRRVRQDHEPQTLFIKFVTNEQLDTVFDRMYEKFPLEAFTKLYSDVEEMRMLGARDWNPNAPEAHLNHVMEKYNLTPKG